MIVYKRYPIDFWPGWLTEAQFKAQLTKIYITEDAARILLEYKANLKLARRLAEKLGWEGDERDGPYIAGLPALDSGGHAYLIAWKQDNDGTSFVASPFHLAWLETDGYQEHIEG